MAHLVELWTGNGRVANPGESLYCVLEQDTLSTALY